jgi:high-affinity K+ transport system ATPase subunit B
MKIILIFVLLFSFSYCSEKKAEGSLKAKSTAKQNEQEEIHSRPQNDSLIGQNVKENSDLQEELIILETFDEVPNEIEGCGCYFFYLKKMSKC